ncbi:MAG: SufS family cysteine desulfurase [Actinomycetaceae bacterium]|nr:SufS family cysteine desulfurase [Actinomycetaceae bacterium]
MSSLSNTTFTGVELDNIRRDFPILRRLGRSGEPLVYLDSAATSQKPQQVIDAVSQFYSLHNGAVNRGTHLLADESTDAYEQARARVAQFIGAKSAEIVWTKNATEALNLVAGSMLQASLGAPTELDNLRLGEGDRIVVTRAEHHANLVPWQILCARTGAELAWLDLHEDGRIDLETLNRITPNTKVVAFTHVSNVTGAISPVAQIVAAAQSVGALTVLDTCQSSAHMPLNISALDVDFAVLSSHKMYGPTGVGALWGRGEILAQMPPFLTGGSMVTDVSMEETTFQTPPSRFEAGSQPVAQIVGWSAALDYLDKVGMDRICAHEDALGAMMLEGIANIPGVRVLGPTEPSERVAVVAFAVDGVHPHDVGQILDAHSVAIRVGHHCAIPLHRHFGVRSSARASASMVTSETDIDRFVFALGKVRDFFGVA